MDGALRSPSLATERRGLGIARYALLFLVCMFAFLPGISTLPPTDRDESRFVQSTKQMVETGNYVDIRLQQEARYKKPIGIYWLQSAAVLLSGDGPGAPIWIYRLVSVLGGTLAVLVTGWLGARMFGRGAGLIGGIALAGIVMLGFEARIAKTDAMLCATAMFAQAALADIYLRYKEGRVASRASPWVFWTAQGAAVLIKGPVAPLISLLTVLAVVLFDKHRAWLKNLKALRGILLAILITAPWLILITLKSGGAFWHEAVGKDLLGKVGGAQESHGAPPGFYALIYVLFFWPFAYAALEAGLKAFNRFRTDPRLLFCLAWYIPYWLVIELIPTKLPHYILPAYPAFILLMAWMVTDGAAKDIEFRSWQVWLRHATLVGFALVTMLLAVAAVGITPYLMKTISWWGILAAVLVLLSGWLGSGVKPALPPLPRIFLATICAAGGFGLLTVFVLPGLKPLWLSTQIANAFRTAKPCPISRLVSVGYAEPSLVFLAGTDTLLTDAGGAAEAMASDKCAVAVVAGQSVDAFLKALPRGQASLDELGTVKGLNYSKGTEKLFILFRHKS
jgi:4-amino-4-deoxy-L-arabinose transferase-like glycosyltransferase